MRNVIVVAARATVFTLVLTGIAYPLFITGLAKILFPARAGGGLVSAPAEGRAVGAELIGQPFRSPGYLHPRPSAAGPGGYDAAASGGSNLATTSQTLRERARAEAGRLRAENPEAPAVVPGDLVAASGSGLDPHLSPEASLWQAPRIARARGVSVERVRATIASLVEGRDLGFLGEPRVNVLSVNLALDRQLGRPPRVE